MRKLPLALLFAAVVIGFAVMVQITLQGPRTIPYYTSGNLTFADVGYATTSYYGDIVMTTNSTANATLYFTSAVFVIPKGEFQYNTTYRTTVRESSYSATYELYFNNVYGYGSIARVGVYPVLHKAIMVEVGDFYLFYPTTYSPGDVVVCPYKLSVYAVTGYRLAYDPSASATSKNPVLYWDQVQVNCGGAIPTTGISTSEFSYTFIRTTLSPSTPYTYKSAMTMGANPTVYGQPYIMIAAQAKAPTQITIEFK